jgi:hypothetical protein
MSNDMKADLWKKLQLITEGMNRTRVLAEARRWEEARDLLHNQEQACRQFARLVELRFESSVEPDELTQQFCQTLLELQGLIDELQQSFGQRREDLLVSLGQLNEQHRVTKQYQGSTPEISREGWSARKAQLTEGNGSSKPNRLSGVWSPRRLALYS